MGLPFLIAALILKLNATTWFAGEDGVETALWWVGGILMGLTLLWWVVVLIAGGFAGSRSSRW